MQLEEVIIVKLLKRMAVLTLCVLAVSGCTKSSITTQAPVAQPAGNEVSIPDDVDMDKLAALQEEERVVEKTTLIEEDVEEKTMFDWEQVDDEAVDLFEDTMFYPEAVKMEYAADEEALTIDLTWVLKNGTTEEVAMEYAAELVQKFNDILAVQVTDVEYSSADSFGGVWKTFALTVKVGTEDGTWLIEKSYAAGAEIDLELPMYSGEGPSVNASETEAKLTPGSKN